MDVTEDGKVQHVVFFSSTSILSGVPLVDNAQYPGIADDLAASFKKFRTLPCDVFLAPHTGFFNLPEKAERLARGEKPNPFIDARAFKGFLETAEKKFLTQRAKEQKVGLEKKALGN
jgi:metallo-beta-lactamase class B